MLCAQDELGLGEDSAGLWELPHDASIGLDISNYLKLDDHIIDIELTPNRGDCASILGVAREVCLAKQNIFFPGGYTPGHQRSVWLRRCTTPVERTVSRVDDEERIHSVEVR